MKQIDIGILKSIGFERMDENVYALGGWCVSCFARTLDLADSNGEMVFYSDTAYAIVGYMLMHGYITAEFKLQLIK